MAQPAGRSAYSIAAVSKLTGISCHALRVWERRYNYPVPGRSPSGHRRYGAEEVSALREVIRRVDAGQSVGDAIAAVRAGAAEPAAVEAEPAAPAAWLQRLRDGDVGVAEALFRAEAEGLSAQAVIARLIEPALVEIGEGWFRGEWSISAERCASGFLRRKLGRLLDEAQARNRSPRGTILVGTVQGDRHEGGVLIVSLLLELAGWRAINLGVDVPVAEYAGAVAVWRPRALALSFVLSRNIRKRFEELAQLRGVPVFVGGRSILNYRGLARRYGLIPVAGSAAASVDQILRRFESS